jgi:putative thioredoxin
VSSQDVYVFEVSKSSFEEAVVGNSKQIPVFVEFMGIWSDHCVEMESHLSALAREFAGQFIFAKVDIDAQQELVEKYEINNVPTLKIFKDGEVAQTLEGLASEEELRVLLKFFGIFRESDELREQARQKHMAGETIEAIKLLTEAIQKDPSNVRVAMDMVQVFLDIGELEQAESLFMRLPETQREGETGRALAGQLSFKKLAVQTEGKAALQERIAVNKDDHDARFDLAICLVAEHDYRQAMDNLFAIVEQDREYKEGAARELIIALTNMLAPNEPKLAQEFRRRLGTTLA